MMNPGLLKLELFCRGMQVDESVSGFRDVLRTRGGLGSGIELILPGDLWVNVPVEESFAKKSPFILKADDSLFLELDGERIPVDATKRPGFYGKKAHGVPMHRVGMMQGGYLAFYLGPKCGFWQQGLNCRFCSSGLNVGVTEEAEKSVEQVVEVTRAAVDEGIAEFIHINTGFINDESRGIKFLEPYVRALKKETDLLIGVQTNPPLTDDWIDTAYSMGIDSMSFNFEVFDKKLFAETCPGKHRLIGQTRFFDGLERAASVFPSGCAAGEIIAGLEPVESTIKAVEFITSLGGVPIVAVFRPLKGTAMESHAVPNANELIPVFQAVYDECVRNKIRMSLVKHVPLVIMPIEARFFSGKKMSFADSVAQGVVRTRIGARAVNTAARLRRRFR